MPTAKPDTAVLLRPLQSLINRRIADSSAAVDLCRGLSGRVMAMRVRDTALTLYFTATDESLSLDSEYRGEPDAVITGTPFAFAAMAGTSGDPEPAAGGLQFEGDPEVARRFQRLLALARPDWEEEIARLVGDVAAHQIGNFLRAADAWGRRALKSFTESAAEYVQEESRDVVNRYEQEDFAAEVRGLARLVDEAGERLDALWPPTEGSDE